MRLRHKETERAQEMWTVEVVALGSPSLISLAVSVDVKQHKNEKREKEREGEREGHKETHTEFRRCGQSRWSSWVPRP